MPRAEERKGASTLDGKRAIFKAPGLNNGSHFEKMIQDELGMPRAARRRRARLSAEARGGARRRRR